MPILIPQAGGRAGVQQALEAMAALVDAEYRDQLIVDQAAYVTAHCGQQDLYCRAASILAWVKRKVRYVPDPEKTEGLHPPLETARKLAKGQLAYGDCDDFSMYLAALLKAVGIPCKFRAVGFLNGPLKHVYVVGPKGMILDGTRDEWNPTIGQSLRETDRLEYPA